MRGRNYSSLLGLLSIFALISPAHAQFQSSFATPLPPGPGSVPFIPNGKLMAPVLMPFGAPTAAPVAIYQYPTAQGYPAQGYPAAPVEQPGFESLGTPVPDRLFWATADFLYGAGQGMSVPPLVTVSPPGTPAPGAGALYRGSTIIGFGGQRVGEDLRPGFRAGGGMWFDPTQSRGLDANFFALGDLSEGLFGSSGPGGVVLSRPAVNGTTATNFGIPIAGLFPGGFTTSVDTRILGGDVNYRRVMNCGAPCRVDLIIGFRYVHLGDTLDVWQTGAAPFPIPGLPATTALVRDSLRSRNNFYGPQIGFALSRQLPVGLSVEIATRLAMGVTTTDSNVDGTTFLPAGGVLPTGIFVTPTNSGVRSAREFGVIPEVGLKLGYDLRDNLRINAGYTFLYWNEVQRAPEQYDLTLLAPGRPAYRNDSSDYWMQGCTLGLQLRF